MAAVTIERAKTTPGVRFLWAAGLVTGLPWVFALMMSQVTVPADEQISVLLLVWLGLPHVAATAGLYGDRAMRPMLAGPRYRTVPVLLIAGSAALAAVGGVKLLITINALWTLHHFAKQNLGVVSFAARAAGRPGPTKLDRHVVVATGVAAMFGYTAVLFPKIGVTMTVRPLQTVGLLLLAGCAVLVWRSPARTFMLSTVVFFLPLFLGLNLFSATVAYTAAHSAQYLLMMERTCRVDVRASLVGLIALVGGGWLLTVGNRSSGWFYGAVLGATFAHFVIDAGVWRMTTPEKRAYMRERFTFL